MKAMTLGASPQSLPRIGGLSGATLPGQTLAAAGLLAAGVMAAYLTIATPFVSTLVPDASSPGGHAATWFGVWSFALLAGGAMLVSGASRMAIIVTKRGFRSGVSGPAARALGSRANDLTVVRGVAPNDGGPIPELVIGAFGVAVVHERPASRHGRHQRVDRENGPAGGWQRTDDPLDATSRDADRVRRWLGAADLDFVVHVYAVLVTNDPALQRSPTCALISAEQIPAWMASLPRQRTLTPGRQARLVAMAQPSAIAEAASRKRNW
jgi:hypothetical protein